MFIICDVVVVVMSGDLSDFLIKYTPKCVKSLSIPLIHATYWVIYQMLSNQDGTS